MNNRNGKGSAFISHEDEINAQKNTGVLGSLPNEMLEKIISSVYLKDIKNLRETCRFFGFHPALKDKIKEKSLSIIVSNYKTIILRSGHVYILGNYSSDCHLFDNVYHKSDGKSFINNIYIPRPITVQRPVIKVAAGEDHVLILDDHYNCFGFGYNSYGQLGLCPKFIDYKEPQQITLPNEEPIIDIAAGSQTTFLRAQSGKWYGLGRNSNGQLGIDGDTITIKSPTLMGSPNGKSIIKIINADEVTCAQDDQGQWHACGLFYNLSIFQQIHNNRSKLVAILKLTPVYLPDGKRIVEIKLANDSMFFLSSDGEWLAMGVSRILQSLQSLLKLSDALTPTPLSTLLNKMSIVKIIPSNLKLFFNDDKKQWHVLEYAYTNHGAIEKINVIQLPNQNVITKLISSGRHTLICDDEGNWYGLGSNTYGELGLGKDNKYVATPAKIDFDFTDNNYDEKKA